MSSTKIQCMQDIKRTIWTQRRPTWWWHGPIPPMDLHPHCVRLASVGLGPPALAWPPSPDADGDRPRHCNSSGLCLRWNRHCPFICVLQFSLSCMIISKYPRFLGPQCWRCVMSCLRCVLYGYLKLPSVCGSSKLKTIYEFKVAVLGFCSLIITLHVFSTIPRTTKVLFKFRRLEWNNMTRLHEVT